MSGARSGAYALVALVVLSLPATLGLAADGPSSAGESVWSGFAATDLDGRSWTATELRGRVVLLDFWATWCAPCLAEIPTYRRATARHAADGFLILGVSMDRTEQRRLRSFLRRQGIDWPQVHDGRGLGGPLARRFGVEAVPRTLLVDRAGRVVGIDLKGEVLLAALPALLAQVGEASGS